LKEINEVNAESGATFFCWWTYIYTKSEVKYNFHL
jgi:hypothetical protein